MCLVEQYSEQTTSLKIGRSPRTHPWSYFVSCCDSDMPISLTRNTLTTSSKTVGYADDTQAYVKSKSIEPLRVELGALASEMVYYCNKNGLN